MGKLICIVYSFYVCLTPFRRGQIVSHDATLKKPADYIKQDRDAKWEALEREEKERRRKLVEEEAKEEAKEEEDNEEEGSADKENDSKSKGGDKSDDSGKDKKDDKEDKKVEKK